ncbi:hypothetical protein AQUCO_02600127v1 [Aquilegia coerulea]|uniref:F-box domain-containing protein n=1 Tax=Aquilegia coerulea TaxID=218851 RepID=A0A2G5D7H3_AQUCA|nr:hypothetical protein AQUCO_02600127v1 [Aquilegia coerulea]
MMRRSTRLSSKKVVKSVSLPEVILIEILLRLPVRTLLRCKCVSKDWFELLSSQYFVQLHLNHAHANSIVVFTSGERYSLVVGRSFEYERNGIKTCYKTEFPYYTSVVASCNGFVCLWDYCQSLVILCNPATREHIKVRHCLKIHPSRFSLGFGHDPVTNTYKVVAIKNARYSCTLDDGSGEAYVYTLGTKKWRKFSTSTSLCLFGVYNVPYVNGALHWMFQSKTPVKTQCADSIIAFHLGKEEFREIPWIQTSIANQSYQTEEVCLGELQGCLSLFYTSYNGVTHIWSMKDYGIQESWMKLHSFMVPSRCVNPSYIKPLFIQRNSDILFELIGWLKLDWNHVNKYLYTYNRTNNNVRQYRQCELDCDGVYTYVESLVSIPTDAKLSKRRSERNRRPPDRLNH